MPEVKSGFKDFLIFPPRPGISLLQIEIQRKIDLFPQHGCLAMQAGNQRFFQLFSGAWNKPYASRKRIKNRKICKINYGGQLSASRYEICPQSAGNGPPPDYAMRPASA
jgi:hypothetical protein